MIKFIGVKLKNKQYEIHCAFPGGMPDFPQRLKSGDNDNVLMYGGCAPLTMLKPSGPILYP